MQVQFNTLKYATLLANKGFNSRDARSLMSTLTEIEFNNIHSIQEVDTMLSQSFREIMAEQDKKLAQQRRDSRLRHVEQEKKLAQQQRELETKLTEQRQEFKTHLQEQRNEWMTSLRWTVGTIISVGISLAAYLSALIHYNH